MVEYYLWIKAFHLICVIAWMSGLFYLPRLLVYHIENQAIPEVVTLAEVAERRLFTIIMQPTMFFSLASGFLLANITKAWSFGWMHLKLLCVLGLLTFHFLLNRWRNAFARGYYPHSGRFFRLINEIPTLLLVIIVVSVVLKPF